MAISVRLRKLADAADQAAGRTEVRSVRSIIWPARSLTRRRPRSRVAMPAGGAPSARRGPDEGGEMSNRHWLASYGKRIPAEIDPDAHASVLAMLEDAMQRFADKPAFRCFGQTLTYADTDRLSRDFAAYLQGRLGVQKGDRIAVM